MNRRVLIFLSAVLLLSAGIAAACTDTGDLEGRIEALEQERTTLSEELDSLHEQLTLANMVATLNVLDDVGFHDLNQTIAEERLAPAGAIGSIRTALRAVAATDWPAALDPGAQEFQDKLQTFLTALLADEADAVVDTSLVAHDGYHDFTDTAWTFLAESVGLGTGDAQEGHEGEMDMEGGE